MTELRMSLINQDMPDGKPVGMSAYHAECVDYSPKPLHYSTGKTKCQATNRKIPFCRSRKNLFAQTEKTALQDASAVTAPAKRFFLKERIENKKEKSLTAHLEKRSYAINALHNSLFILQNAAISKNVRLVFHRVFLGQSADHAAGIARGEAVRRDRAGDDAPRADHAAFADGDLGQDRDVLTDPTAPAAAWADPRAGNCRPDSVYVASFVRPAISPRGKTSRRLRSLTCRNSSFSHK